MKQVAVRCQSKNMEHETVAWRAGTL